VIERLNGNPNIEEREAGRKGGVRETWEKTGIICERKVGGIM